MSLTEPTVVGYMNSHDGKLYESKDTCLFWKQRARALELMTVAEHEQIAAPLLERIKELEEANAAFEQRQAWWNERMFALEQQLEAVRKDAERYRWLRHGDNDEVVLQGDCRGVYLPRNERLDAAIDAAISKEQA